MSELHSVSIPPIAFEANGCFKAVLATYGTPSHAFHGDVLSREAAEQLQEKAIGAIIGYELQPSGEKHLFRITEARLDGDMQTGAIVVTAEAIEEGEV